MLLVAVCFHGRHAMLFRCTTLSCSVTSQQLALPCAATPLWHGHLLDIGTGERYIYAAIMLYTLMVRCGLWPLQICIAPVRPMPACKFEPAPCSVHHATWQLEGWLHVEVQVMNCTWCTLVMACICRQQRIKTCCSTRCTPSSPLGRHPQRAAVMIPPQGIRPACSPADLTMAARRPAIRALAQLGRVQPSLPGALSSLQLAAWLSTAPPLDADSAAELTKALRSHQFLAHCVEPLRASASCVPLSQLLEVAQQQ